MKIPLILALLASAAAASQQDWQNLAGDSSRIAEPRAVVVANPGAWDALWREHAGTDAAAPAVDFTQEKVVAVFLGRRGRSGYKVALEADASNPAEVVVTYAEKAPASAFGATMVTTPFVIQKVAARQVRLLAKGGVPAAKAAAPAAAPAAPMAAELSGVKASVARMSDLRDSLATAAAFDGSALRVAANGPEVGKLLAQGLPPPPGGGRESQDTTRNGKPLPPPPGGRQDDRRGGKPLPPPPGQDRDDQGGKPLPPPPGQGRPLPPPPGERLPQPIYPGGPLSKDDARLENAERTYNTYGMQYIGYWNKGTGFAADRGTVRVGPQDAGKSYVLRLDSPQVQETVKFFRDSNGNYYWAPDSDRTGRVVTRRIEVSFGPRTLQPWESESFTFSLEGRDLRLESQDGAYRYSAQSTTDLQDPERVYVTMTPGQKLLTAPDANGVAARLENVGGTLKLVVDDKWAAQYNGETVELAFVVRKDDGSFWSRDPIVLQASTNGPSRFTGARAEFNVTTASGKFYLESWAFRRANSQLSAGHWVSKGKGNTVQK